MDEVSKERNNITIRIAWNTHCDYAQLEFFINHEVLEIECEIAENLKQEVQKVLLDINDYSFVSGDIRHINEEYSRQAHCFSSMISSAMDIELEDMDIIIKDSLVCIYGKVDKCLLN